jgi:putative DNA primase/helicase
VATVVPLEGRTPDLVDAFPRTDSGNAERLISFAGKDLRYVRGWHKWLGWTGKHWQLDEGAPHRAAKAMVRALMKQAQRIGDQERRAAAVKYALKCESKASIEAMVSLARHELAVAIGHEELDADSWLLCCRNGTIDLKTGTLRPHLRDDLITKIAPIDYDPAATCERFERFVLEIMAGDVERVAFLRAFLGYALTGDVREHVLAFWHGGGCNGKSLLAFVVLHVFGDYGGKSAPDLLFRGEHTERHPTELADLHGLRLVVCNETTRGRAWDEATVKDTTGGDVLRARRMREDFWSFPPTHKIVVFGNHKPRIKAIDDAMKRRLRLVPFVVSFEGRQDKNLQQALLAEGPGILRWLVDGCLAWQQDGLPEVEAIREATAGYFRDEDTLGQFIESELVFAPDAKVARKDIRERYETWCDGRGEKALSPKALAEALRDKGVSERKVHTAGGKRDGWAGVRLATDADRDASESPGGEVVTSSERSPVQPNFSVSRGTNREVITTDHYPTTEGQEDFADYVAREQIGGQE